MALTPSDPDYEVVANIWREYGALTRFLESTRIALAHEAERVHAEAKSGPIQSVGIGGDPSKYEVRRSQHLEVVRDEEMLARLVLVQTTALCESLARLCVAKAGGLEGGVEAWGSRCLEANGQAWGSVEGGQSQVVLAFVYRNAIAHGSNELTAKEIRRLETAGNSQFGAGSTIEVAPGLELMRASIRSFMRLTGKTV